MATTATSSASEPIAVRRPAAPLWRRIERYVLPAFTLLALVYLMIPIAVMIVFSFNKPAGKFNYAWNEFSLEGWLHPFAWPGLGNSLITSLSVAVISTIVATILGTMIGLALTRYRFRGRGALNGLIFLPMATPEIVLGASLLTLFVATALPPVAGSVPRLYPTGFHTIVIAHVMFCISFVVVVVRSRLIGFDRRLEEAARDLGAGSFTTFRKITLPLLAPGLIGAAMLAFALSIDDFVISNFNSGTTVTFPLYVYGAALRGIPVQVLVLATMLFLVTVAAIVLVLWQQRRAERMVQAQA
jgi:spermidine/putrescine transport system permease protein